MKLMLEVDQSPQSNAIMNADLCILLFGMPSWLVNVRYQVNVARSLPIIMFSEHILSIHVESDTAHPNSLLNTLPQTLHTWKLHWLAAQFDAKQVVSGASYFANAAQG